MGMYLFGLPEIYFAPSGDGGRETPTGDASGSSPTRTEGGKGGALEDIGAAGDSSSSDVSFTPEQQRRVDDLIKQRLERERAKFRTDQAAEILSLRNEKAARELADLKREVARTAGLTPELAERLQGTIREELEEDAKKLAELLPPDPRPMIAVEVGLPKELAGRIKRGSREEMLADAKELLKYVRPSSLPGSPPAKPRIGAVNNNEIDKEREKAIRQRFRIR